MDKSMECPECKNQIKLEKEYNVDDVVECPFCGIELEVTAKDDAGNLSIQIIEEEK